MKESDFALEMEHSILRILKGCHYKNIPDAIYNPRGRFNPEKGYDAYVSYKGHFTAIEYKLHKTKNAWPLNSVRLSEKVNLREVDESGGNAYIVLGIRYHMVRLAYFMPIKVYYKYLNTLNRKSVPLEIIMKTCESCPWLGKGKWDINKGLFK